MPKEINKPLLFEIEAPDFAGKTTLINNLKKAMKNKTHSFFSEDKFEFFRLPGSTPFSEKCRALIKQYKTNPISSAALAFAAQMDFYKTLESKSFNKNIILDRGLLSFIVYQGYLTNFVDADHEYYNCLYDRLKDQIDKQFKRYVIFLSISDEEYLNRRASRSKNSKEDIYDDLAYSEKIRNGYNWAVKNLGYPPSINYILDANKLPNEMTKNALNFIKSKTNDQ